MFGIGGFNPVSLLATAAFGPAGGIIAQLATQVFSQMGQQLLQQMGNNLGLPQSAIDMAQSSFTGRLGDFQGSASNLAESIEQLGRETGATPTEIGDAQRSASDILLNTLREASESREFKEARRRGNAPGWLMAMAEALGNQLNELGDEMTQRANTMTKDDPKASAQFSVVTQQFSMLMNATTNAIKTVGEAMGNAARKQ